MKWLKKIGTGLVKGWNATWNFLDGRKRDIGAYSGVAIAWLLAKHIVDDATAQMIATALSIWVGAATVHGGIKKDL